MASKKIKSFSISGDEKYLFVGNLSGELLTVSTDNFAIVDRIQSQPGGIIAVATHKTLPYVATMGMDRSVVLFKIVEEGRLEKTDSIIIRDIPCDNDEINYDFILSVSQALNFHPVKKKIVTRSGNSGVLELSFENEKLTPIRCTRLHGKYDVVTVSYVRDTDMILSGSNHGEVVLSENGKEIRQWRFGHETIHWFEHLKEDEYLIASDMRAVVKFSLSSTYEPIIWDNISRDDLEHVTFNRTSGRAFASSFDRNVYEIDTRTCQPLAVVYTTPFKNRWIKTLEKDPDKLIIQCRNGALYLVSLASGELLAEIRETPYALWSGDYTKDGEIVIAGEGNKIMRLMPAEEDAYTRTTDLKSRVVDIDTDPDYYTKRLVFDPVTNCTILGRTDGRLTSLTQDNRTELIYDLGSPIRDLALRKGFPELFVATEDGKVHIVNLESGLSEEIYNSPRKEPVWAIAYNDEAKVLAIAEREGFLSFLEGEDYNLLMDDMDCHRPKRMKWLDHEQLYYSNGANLFRINISTWEKESLLKNVGNTIEDFIWDPGKRYMVMVNYQRNLLLMDIMRGVLLQSVSDEIDYSKGALWLQSVRKSKNDYFYNFITYGRSGRALQYRIHDEKIVALGPAPGIVSINPVRAKSKPELEVSLS